METDSQPVVLVTGASGFVGSALCSKLSASGYAVRGTRRGAQPSDVVDPASWVTIQDIGPDTVWDEALCGVTAVVHLAARVHVMHETAAAPLAEFRAVNTAGTKRLARQAVAAGVKRFVYVSTIKVNGERTLGRPFCAGDDPHPENVYAQSKLEAELALKEICQQSGLEVVIVRPPLIYGPGVKGNFLSMLRVIQQGWPLPLASCDNRRSYIGLTNFVSLLEKCVTHPAAAGQVILAADGEDLSTSELLRRVSHALGKSVCLFPFPPSMLRFAAKIARRPGIYERLCGSLQVDAVKSRELISWIPPSSVDKELVRTATWFLALSR